jgi:hypothetical protein
MIGFVVGGDLHLIELYNHYRPMLDPGVLRRLVYEPAVIRNRTLKHRGHQPLPGGGMGFGRLSMRNVSILPNTALPRSSPRHRVLTPVNFSLPLGFANEGFCFTARAE